MALKGINVIEFAGIAPSPFCGLILSDFGARVLRIDKLKAPEVNLDHLGRGKQSISVNLKKEEGISVVKHLCRAADVLIEPFRPGAMENLGLGPSVLCRENPRLVYARLTGFGQQGELSQKAGHDINYIAQSGVLSKLGRKREPPYAPVNLVAALGGGGALCALGITLALFERSRSGQGQVIDANMVEGSAYMCSWYDAARSVISPKPRGQNLLDGGRAYYDTYETKDGKYMAVGAFEPYFFLNVLKGLGLDSKGITQGDDQDKLRELFKATFLTKTQDEWTETFQDLDACVNAVLSTDEAIKHPHNKYKGSFIIGERDPFAGPAPRLSRSKEIRTHRPKPAIGEHTVDILKEYGFSQADISDLISKGAVGPSSV